MEVVQTSNIKIPNSHSVSGLTGTEVDEELYDFLKQYGSIERGIPVEDSQSELSKEAIVEYTREMAIQSMSSSLPCDLPSNMQTNVTYYVRALPNEHMKSVEQRCKNTAPS